MLNIYVQEKIIISKYTVQGYALKITALFNQHPQI
jgi:hypothetical protein